MSKLFYAAEITMPRVIQFDDPQALPVSLQIVPCREQTAETIQDVPQEFRINRMWYIHGSLPKFGISMDHYEVANLAPKKIYPQTSSTHLKCDQTRTQF